MSDRKSELQRKIKLLEEESRADYERSQATIQKNRESILQMRQETERLRRKLAEKDEQVIDEAFKGRGKEIAAFRNKSVKAALDVVKGQVFAKQKKLNAMKHDTQKLQKRLEDLQLEAGSKSPRLNSQQAAEQKNLRILENRLEKVNMKYQAAENITRGYLKIKAHMQEESLTFQPQLDSLETEIMKKKRELQELQVTNSEAQKSMEMAKAELQREEELVYQERRERERTLNHLKKQVEEHKAQAERVERRAQRAAMQQDELSSEAPHSAVAFEEEEEQQLPISLSDEPFQRIKEATGLINPQEIVEWYVSQENTQKQLESLKVENEKTLQQLKEELEQLQGQLQDMKYSKEEKAASRQKELEECRQHLQVELQRRDAAKEHVDSLGRTLITVQAGVEHLSDKLEHIQLPADEKVQVDPNSEEYILQLLVQVEKKMLQLQEELHGKDLATITKEMEDEEFLSSIERHLPLSNTRIQQPEAQKQDPYDDDDDVSADHESDVITRATLKHKSQLIIDSKAKRKTRTKKKSKI
ncbi:coiled-coil domain-containing protein 151 isoform X2 [Denticeps clupeoides]|uniref:ODAD1 central coiled coil region domain-containing protein n=1 Tax=Denticeps clupeoides TaxID=299321 RepID=A0AAY4DDH9_9TELE|nr:coiled-coil domain-containing protein 151 isoform X2 [Denticeps clupeoides]